MGSYERYHPNDFSGAFIAGRTEEADGIRKAYINCFFARNSLENSDDLVKKIHEIYLRNPSDGTNLFIIEQIIGRVDHDDDIPITHAHLDGLTALSRLIEKKLNPYPKASACSILGLASGLILIASMSLFLGVVFPLAIYFCACYLLLWNRGNNVLHERYVLKQLVDDAEKTIRKHMKVSPVLAAVDGLEQCVMLQAGLQRIMDQDLTQGELLIQTIRALKNTQSLAYRDTFKRLAEICGVLLINKPKHHGFFAMFSEIISNMKNLDERFFYRFELQGVTYIAVDVDFETARKKFGHDAEQGYQALLDSTPMFGSCC